MNTALSKEMMKRITLIESDNIISNDHEIVPVLNIFLSNIVPTTKIPDFINCDLFLIILVTLILDLLRNTGTILVYSHSEKYTVGQKILTFQFLTLIKNKSYSRHVIRIRRKQVKTLIYQPRLLKSMQIFLLILYIQVSIIL